MSAAKDPCPCGSTRPYRECCGIWHAGTPAPDAESLMRSRYSAFVLCNEQYLLATWHPAKRPPSIPFNQNQKWLGLRIVEWRTTGDATAEAGRMLRDKKLDLVVANDVSDPGSAFGSDTDRVTFVSADGVEALPLLAKTEVARRLVAKLAERLAR